MAATVPLTLGGDIINQVTGAIKKHYNKVPGVKHVQDFAGARKAAGEQRRKESVRSFRRNLAISGGGVGRFAAGVRGGKEGAEVARLREENISEIQKTLAPMKGDYEKLSLALKASKQGSDMEAALLREIGEGGYVNTGDQDVMDRFERNIVNGTSGVGAAAFKLKDSLHPALAARALEQGREIPKAIMPIAESSLKSVDYGKINKDQLSYLAKDDEHIGNLVAHLSNKESRTQWERTATPAARAAVKESLRAIETEGTTRHLAGVKSVLGTL